MSIVTDIPLGYMRKLVSEVRTREQNKESWQSWYNRTGSGQLVRQASTATCILNEIIFGVSDKAVDALGRIFRGSLTGQDDRPFNMEDHVPSMSLWKVSGEQKARSYLIDCIGSLLHEYLSPEIWSLPLDNKSSNQQPDGEVADVNLHFVHDVALLYQENTFSFSNSLCVM